MKDYIVNHGTTASESPVQIQKKKKKKKKGREKGRKKEGREGGKKNIVWFCIGRFEKFVSYVNHSPL